MRVALARGARGVETLELNSRLVESFGWVRLEARWGDVAGLLVPLLEELVQERCVHSWRRRLARQSSPTAQDAQAMLLAEDKQRPTTCFVYVAIDGDGLQTVIGAGCVSDRVRDDFPYEGYPVLARCYIRPRFRGHGLYRVFLRHRYDYCLGHWGDELCAIHLGSAEQAVWKVAMERGTFDPPFVHIGEEDLEVAGKFHRVRDLLAFQPGWVARLKHSVARIGDGPRALALQEHLAGLVTRGMPPYGFVALRDLMAEVSGEIGRDPRELSEPLRGLMALGDAIPVVR